MKINTPDSIWKNGRLFTLESNTPSATALAIQNGRILAIGSDSEILDLASTGTKIYDFEGQYVYPGFIEGHMHLLSYGDSLLTLPIRDLSKQQILNAVQLAVQNASPGEWILGGMGWNNEVWEDPAYPTMQDLDAVAPNNPVLLPRMDGHLVWANSAAFEAAGVTSSTPNPENGEFMRKADGSLLGCASNQAAQMIKAVIPKQTAADRRLALIKAQEQLLKFGVTSVNDMGTTAEMIDDLKALYEDDMYHLRFHGALQDALAPDASPEIKAHLQNGPQVGLYDGKLTIRACKILGDGAIGAQSAALKQDYSDRPGHRGVKMQTDDELLAMLRKAASSGMQVVTHAIGDDTIDQILRTYKQVLEEYPNLDHRWHIEHFQTVSSDSDQCERARELGVWASMQPMHAPNSASMAMRRLGEDRASRAYAGGFVLGKLGRISWGSDAPVATPSPFSGMHAAITRTNDKLQPTGGFFMENAVTPTEALLGYTKWGAYAQFTENDKGTLAPGKYADFVVLDHDLLATAQGSPDDLLKIKVLRTVIGGNLVYVV